MEIQTDLVIYRTSEIHGTGGFARVDIREGTEIVEYTGENISKEESQRRCELNNPYIFDIDETTDLDGNVEWNLARFINHSCSPNCEAQWDEKHIWIVAIRDIRAGEELTFNYGYDLDDYQDHPCRCGASNCVGFIVAEELFEELRRRKEAAAGVAPQQVASGP
ncbi:MAG TPA: SET domain-containing protein-lysine N-methyltransferase [Verrucomicrobiae bacterium]|nr:SET domain-containing protein-lysine N-methyltransferase [Verrucomicrobiae bacterium]